MTDNDEDTQRITFPPAVQATDRMTDRIRTAAGGQHAEPVSGFGPEWDRIVNLVTEHRYQPVPRLIIATGKWVRILRLASEEDRVILERMEACGQVIVTPHLPSEEVAYRYTPRAGDHLSGSGW